MISENVGEAPAGVANDRTSWNMQKEKYKTAAQPMTINAVKVCPGFKKLRTLDYE